MDIEWDVTILKYDLFDKLIVVKSIETGIFHQQRHRKKGDLTNNQRGFFGSSQKNMQQTIKEIMIQAWKSGIWWDLVWHSVDLPHKEWG